MLHTISRNADLVDQAILSATTSLTSKRAAKWGVNNWSKLLRPTAVFTAHDALERQTPNANSNRSDNDELEGQSFGETDSQSEEQTEDDDDSNEEQAESLEEEKNLREDKSNIIGTRDAPQEALNDTGHHTGGAPLRPPPIFLYDALNPPLTIEDQIPQSTSLATPAQ